MSVFSTLTALQAAAVNILTTDNFFTGIVSANQKPIPIVTEAKGDIVSQIQICLGQVGIAALVLTPLFEFHDHLVDDLNGWAYITITVYEDVVVNQGVMGTGISGIILAERIVCILHSAPHGVQTGATSGNQPSTFLGIPRPIALISEGPPLHYNIGFQAHVQLNSHS
jgi:hypothetical protein